MAMSNLVLLVAMICCVPTFTVEKQQASKTKCVALDSCSCEMSDGSGTVNLRALDKPTDPMRDDVTPLQSYLFNPCSPIVTPYCEGNSLCEERGNSLIYLGLANASSFEVDNTTGTLSLKYTSSNAVTSTVNLVCDRTQMTKPFFRVGCSENTYNVHSVCACPGGCKFPPPGPPPVCIQSDSCTCKSTVDSATINLHDLDYPCVPLTAKDSEGYTYYYNPCSGLQISGCVGSAGCMKDPHTNTYYSLGLINSLVDYNTTATEKHFVIYYTGGSGGRSFDVRIICDRNEDKSIFTIDGNIHKETLLYHFVLKTKLACST